MKDIYALIEEDHMKQISTEFIISQIIWPVCINCSINVFCRKYPEKFYLHIDTNSGLYWVRKPPTGTGRLFQLSTTADTPSVRTYARELEILWIWIYY